MLPRLLLFAFAFLPGIAALSPASAAPPKTGVLSGKVVVEGPIKRLERDFDPYAALYPGPRLPPPEHLVVYLDNKLGHFKPPRAHLAFAVKDRQFPADVLPVLAGQAVDFQNDDPLYHHLFSYSELKPFDLGRRGQGETRSVAFTRLPSSGIGVVTVFCQIHAHMRCHILVMRNPYWAVLPESGGQFEMANLPAGDYTLNAWHASLLARPVHFSVRAGKRTEVVLKMKAEEN